MIEQPSIASEIQLIFSIRISILDRRELRRCLATHGGQETSDMEQEQDDWHYP